MYYSLIYRPILRSRTFRCDPTDTAGRRPLHEVPIGRFFTWKAAREGISECVEHRPAILHQILKEDGFVISSLRQHALECVKMAYVLERVNNELRDRYSHWELQRFIILRPTKITPGRE